MESRRYREEGDDIQSEERGAFFLRRPAPDYVYFVEFQIRRQLTRRSHCSGPTAEQLRVPKSASTTRRATYSWGL